MSNFEVNIRDYRCIKNISLELKPGLNVLRGTSNSGKSSVFSAIKSCIYNTPGTKNVRNGKSSYIIDIKYNNQQVTYQKGKSGNSYSVNNEQYTKTGVNQLPAVAQALNIQDIQMADEKVKVNFWNQMQYPFLLDKTSSQLYKFISDSGEDEALSATLKSMVKDRQAAAVQTTLLEGKIQVERERSIALEKKVKESEEISKVCTQIIECEPEIKNIQSLREIKTTIEEKMQRGREIQINYKKIPSVTEVDLKPIEIVIEEEKQLKIISEDVNRYMVAATEKMQAYKKIPEIDSSYMSIETMIQEKKIVQEIDTQYQKYSSELERVQGLIEKLYSEDVESINVPELQELKVLLSTNEQSETRLASLEQQLYTRKDVIKDLEEELNGIKVCPTCGKEF